MAVGVEKVAKQGTWEFDALPVFNKALGAGIAWRTRDILLLQVAILTAKVEDLSAPSPGISVERGDAEVFIDDLVIVIDQWPSRNENGGKGQESGGCQEDNAENQGDVVTQ